MSIPGVRDFDGLGPQTQAQLMQMFGGHFGPQGGMPFMGGMQNPIMAAAQRQYGPMDWARAGQFAQQANYSQMDPGAAMQLSGHQGFAGQLGGAMGQIGSALQGNADRMAAARSEGLNAELMREARNDANQKFTMVFNELLGNKQREQYRDAMGNIQYREVSPLIQLLGKFMPGGSTSSSSFSVVR